MSTRARALLLSAAASAVGVAQPFAPGQLVALRTAASADVALGQTLPAFVDVLSAATGELVRTINLPVDNSTGGLALTLRRSTVEGHFARSEDGCTVTVAGYNVAPFTPNAAGINNPTVARSAAVIAADGSVTSATGDLALAQLPALARGAAILPGAGLYFSSDYGMSLNVTLNTTRVGPPALLSQSNTRSAFVYRGALLTASASNVPPSQAGVWILNPDLSLPLSPLPANSSGLLLASAPAPYGAAVIDDFTIIVADQSSGLMLFRSALTLPGAAPGSPWTSGWLLVATATDPGLAGNGFSHVGVDTSSGQVGLAAGVYATTFKAATDNDNAARVYRVAIALNAADPTTATMTLTLLVTSPAGFEYRGVAGAPVCVPLPSPTPFPVPSPSASPSASTTPSPSRNASSASASASASPGQTASASPVAPPGPSSFPPGALLALRTPARADLPLGQTLPAVIDVLDGATGTPIGAPIILPTGPAPAGAPGLALTVRRSAVEGHVTRTDSGCVVTFAGYASAPFVPNAASVNNASVARSAAIVLPDGTVNVTTADLGLALLPAQARGAALVPGVGVVWTTDFGVSLPTPLGTTRAPIPGLGPANYDNYMISTYNVRAAAVYRGGLFIASASNVPPITSGVWLVNPTFAPPTAPVASPGTLLATAPYPYGLVILDDFTFVVADQVAGLLVFRSNLTLPGANVALSSWEQPWFLAGQAMDPAVPTNGFSHVGVDTSSGGTGLAGSRVYATTYKESTDNTLVARVYRVNVTVSAAAPAVAAVALTAFASSPPGYEYRGLAGAPRCVPLPAPTPFPTPGPAPPTPSGRPSSGAGAAPAAAVAAALATGAAVVATAAVAARREW